MSLGEKAETIGKARAISGLTVSGYGEIIERLERHTLDVLGGGDIALVSVVGKNGSGKSHLGKHIRKNGLGSISGRHIAVIDDGTMSHDFLFFFTRRLKIPTTGVDELRPFLEELPRRIKVILYINYTPARRITRADILLKLSVGEGTRMRRLEERYGKGSEKFNKYFHREEITDFNISYTYYLEHEMLDSDA
jgi:hypothetical protein